MALYIEQRIDQLEAHAVEDGKLLETVANGLGTLTVQVQRNYEQAQRNHEQAQRNNELTNQRIDEVNHRIDKLDQRIDEVVTILGDVKVTLSLVLRLLEAKLP